MELLDLKEATELITTCTSHYHTLELILDIWVLSTYKFACAQHDFSYPDIINFQFEDYIFFIFYSELPRKKGEVGAVKFCHQPARRQA